MITPGHPFARRARLLVLAALAALVLSCLHWRAAKSNGAASRQRTAGDTARALAPPLAPEAAGPAAPDPAPGSARLADPAAARQARADALAKTQAFTDWLTAWRRAGEAEQPALAATGRQLALARRAALRHLIETDPRRALEFAVPAGLRAALPADVRAQLEQRLDARGDLDVAIACGDDEARMFRTVTVAGQRHAAFVFGRREQQATKTGLPLHGIALDGAAALDETPFRVLDDDEKSAVGAPREKIAVLVGDDVTLLDTADELKALEQRLVAAESAPGPQLSGDTGDPVRHGPDTAAVTSPPSWINGNKRVLWLKLEFADDPGAPALDDDITASGAAINDFYTATSYTKTTMAITILPSLLRLPRDKAYYNTSSTTTGDLRDDAKAAAKAYDAANGATGAYDPDKFDRWIMVFKRVPAYTFGGLATIGGTPVWLNNTVGAGTAAHELGHNHSLNHSHAWRPSGASPIGPGTHVEYGDLFDRMGTSGSGPSNFFNVAQKAKLGYLDDTGITTVTAAGTYRLTRHDHKDSTGIRALKVGASNVEYEYWIEHRRLGPTALTAAQLDRLQNGVLLHWGPAKLPKFVPGPGSYLLDMTPGTAAGTSDAPLRIGESFTDPDAGITIQPLAIGGTAPNEYIDVQISFGATGTNRNPVLIAEAPAGPVSARTNLIFTANATDPDGDPVYFRWDFGDGKVQPNLNTTTERYLKGGSYTVNVSAHDGKGGLAAKSYPLTVVDPLVNWTRRAGTLTTNPLNDVTYGDGQFVAVGINYTVLTSPDGAAWTRQTFPTGISLTGVAYDGVRYVVSGYRYSNPTQKGLAAYSTDAVNWTTVNLDTGLAQFWAVASGAGRFVMVGDSGAIYSSPDGATWTAVTPLVSTTLRTVTFANGLFVAVGDSGRVLTSPDGVTWTNRSLATSASFWGVARYNNLWYAVAGSTIYTSPDGAAWTRVSGTTAPVVSTYKAVPVGGVIAVGVSAATLEFAENTQSWATVVLDSAANPSVTSIRGFAEAAGVIVAVGNSGQIFTTTTPTTNSPPLAAPAMRVEGDSLKLSVGRKNIIAAGGAGYTRLELYANSTKVSEISGPSGFFTWTPAAIGNYALTIRGVDATGASAISASYPAQAALANWNWHNPAPVGSDLTGAVRVDGKWWIVGNTGNFFTLDVAGNFNAVDFATTQNLTGIGYGNGRFVVTAPYTDGGSRQPVGDPWTSTDGFAWTALLTSTIESISLNNVIYAGGRWLAFSSSGMLTSNDGLSWARQTVPTSVALWGAAYGNNLYVVVGGSGKIITSPNGVTWTERTSGVTTDLRKVAFNNGTFVAAGLSGVILSSPDGVTWTRRTSGVTTSLYGAGVIKGTFVVAGDSGVVLTSADAVTWTQALAENRTTNFLFVAGAEGEGLLLGRAGEVYTATTATSYKRVTQGTSDNHTAVIYAGGKFVAVGQAIDPLARNAALAPIAVSSDGTTWTRAAANAAFASLTAVTYGQSRYVAIGPSIIFTSTDATTWTQSPFTNTVSFSCVAAGPAAFVAGSSGSSVYSSPDGTTWSARNFGTTFPVRGAAYGNGRFVLVGDSGNIRYSPDGTTWTAATSGTTSQLLSVGYFDNVGFIATGASGTMLGSADGATWQPIETGISDTIYTIAFTPIGFVAPAGTAGTMLLSLDGVNWTIGTIPIDRPVRGIAASATSLVAVGDNGALLSYDLADPTPAPVIAAQPAAQALLPGATATFAVSAQNAAGGAYQWFKDGTPIVGANGPTYTTTAAGSNLGSYTVALATPTGSVTSAAALLSLANAANPTRLINLSILTPLAAGETMTMGTALGGAGTIGTKALLVRAVGPSLGALGVTGTLPDPTMTITSTSTTPPAVFAINNDWGGSASLSNAFAAVGAFPYATANSKDAAVFNPAFAAGNYTVQVSGNGTAGTMIAEIYDSTPGNAFTATTPRLVNVSVLKQIGAGESLTAGFVVGGSGAKQVLIRAVGPGLAQLGVGGTMADPQLTLNQQGLATPINSNNDWGGGATLATAFANVGAFALPAASKDAALLVTLQPGNYTAQVTGVAGSAGLVLVEVYEVP